MTACVAELFIEKASLCRKQSTVDRGVRCNISLSGPTDKENIYIHICICDVIACLQMPKPL